MIAVAVQLKLERLRFDQPVAGDIVDHDMGEIGLTGHRAERGELGGGKAQAAARKTGGSCRTGWPQGANQLAWRGAQKGSA